MLKYLKYRMRVICIKEFKHTYLDGKPNKIFEIFPVRGVKPFEHNQICIKTDVGGFWINKEFFLPLEEYRNQQLEKLLK